VLPIPSGDTLWRWGCGTPLRFHQASIVILDKIPMRSGGKRDRRADFVNELPRGTRYSSAGETAWCNASLQDHINLGCMERSNIERELFSYQRSVSLSFMRVYELSATEKPFSPGAQMTHVYSAFFLTSSNDRFRVSLSLDTILSSSLSGGGWY